MSLFISQYALKCNVSYLQLSCMCANVMRGRRGIVGARSHDWMLIVQSHVAIVQSFHLLLATCWNSFGSSHHVTAWKHQLVLSTWSNPHLSPTAPHMFCCSWVFFPPWTSTDISREQFCLFFFFLCFMYRFFFLILWQAHLPHSDGGFVIWVEFGFIKLTQKDAWIKTKL